MRRILYFERLGGVDIVEPMLTGPSSQKPQPPLGSLTFEAFGRHFVLPLQRNDALIRKLPGVARRRVADVVLYRGEVAGLPGSWVRLTRHGPRLSGVIWDGTDLYAIEPYDRVASLVASPGGGAAGATIIYRSRDTIGDAGDRVLYPLALAGVSASGSSVDFAASATAISPGRQLDIGLVADAEFAARESTYTRTQMLNIANVIDGIFGQQLGVHINVAALEVYDTEPDPFTSNDSDALLGEVGEYKNGMPALRGLGVVHLLTGRGLVSPDGRNILGIANLGALCDPQFGVSLSAASDTATQALVAAHELGHNFGAPHDSESGSACEATPPTFLMAALYNGSDQFSDCSIAQMQVELASAACLTDVPPNDVSVVPENAPVLQVPAGVPFFESITLENTGPDDAVGVEMRVDATNMELTGHSGYTTCNATSASSVVCPIYRLPAGQPETVSINAVGLQPGPGTFDVQVTSWNDPDLSNNNHQFPVEFLPSVDFQPLAVSAMPSLIHPDETSEITFDFVNTGVSPATDVVLDISFGAQGLEPLAFSPPGGGSCDRDPGAMDRWLCAIGAVPQNESQRLSIQVRPSSAMPPPPPGSYSDGSVSINVVAAEPDVDGFAQGSTTVKVASAIADLALEVNAPDTVVDGSPIEVSFVGRNDGPDTADNVSLKLLDYVGTVLINGIVSGSATCAVASEKEGDCTLASLAVGESFTVTVHGVARNPGAPGNALMLKGVLQSGAFDPSPGNADQSSDSLFVAAPPPPSAGGGGGGGGGALDPLFLAVLLAMALQRLYGMRRVNCGSMSVRAGER